MPHYKYIIIGGGMTADSAVSGIREVDVDGSIGIVSAESDPPYDRPPLTKALWKGKPLDSIWRHTEKKKNVHFHLGHSIERIEIQRKRVLDNQQNVYTFEKLLLATGGRPRRLPFGNDQIIYFRTVRDYQRLRSLTEDSGHFAVIGNGFIGSEIAAALAMNQQKVVMIFPGTGICDRIFPRDLSEFLNEYYRQRGVEVLAGDSVTGLNERGDNFVLHTSRGKEIPVTGVVAGIGIQPNIELAQAAGLKIENGVVVNEFMQTTHPAIYAAGDVAAFYSAALENYIRVEHEDNANSMGRLAGRNMTGTSDPYRHLPFFYSDLFDLGYEAVGDLDARLETVVDWKTRYREGVVYYMRAGRIRGVLLWNVWGQVDAARNLISELGPFEPHELKGRLPAPERIAAA